jgi:hypothetical protein
VVSEVLTPKPWMVRSRPFPHVVATDVFRPHFLARLTAAFEATVAAGAFSSGANYTRRLPAEPGSPFALFVSRPWHDLLARLTTTRATGDVDAGLHHHRVGRPAGHIHNDLNPGYFVGTAGPARVNLSRPGVCNYYQGTCTRPELTPRATVRAVAMLFYLANPPWQPGDGGETGLYTTNFDTVGQPAAAVPPINNSMLVFACTPYSFHGFLGNPHHERNSVILWLHRSRQEAEEQWGKDKIVSWPSPHR